MGHKWMWNRLWGGFPENEFLRAVDPLLDGIAEKMPGVTKLRTHCRRIEPGMGWKTWAARGIADSGRSV